MPGTGGKKTRKEVDRLCLYFEEKKKRRWGRYIFPLRWPKERGKKNGTIYRSSTYPSYILLLILGDPEGKKKKEGGGRRMIMSSC